MTPARERVVLQSLPVEQQDKFTEDYCRGDMAVFEVNHLVEVDALLVVKLGFRSKVLPSVFLNVSLSPARGSSDPCFSVVMKVMRVRTKARFSCLI